MAKTRSDAKSKKRSLAHRPRRTRNYSLSITIPRLRAGTRSISGSRLLAMWIFLAMVALLVWFGVDLRFYVFEAQIQGNALVNADEVHHASRLEGWNIFYVNRAQVAENIRREVPGVFDVQVECRLPASVRISIREQGVFCIWWTVGGAFLLDREGLVLKAYDGQDGNLLSITDLDHQPLKPGDRVDQVAVNAASCLHSLMPEVKAFEYSRAKGLSLLDARGLRVYFGDDQQLPEKVATMHAVLDRLAKEGRSVKLIDLRFLGSPYYE